MKLWNALFLLAFLSVIITDIHAQKKLVIIGSSTSACMNVDPVTECYTGRLNSYYNKQTPLDTTIDNHLARGGSNCYNGMPSSYIPPYDSSLYQPVKDINITAALALKPDVILVNYPTNEYNVLSISEVMFCLRTIRDSANKNGVPCFITTTQPRTSFPIYNNSAMKLRLAILKDSILNAFGPYAIDFWTGLINPADSSILYDSGDKTHMNATGHAILFQRVMDKNVFTVPATAVAACVVNTSPANASVLTTQTSATLSWPASSAAVSYDVYLWTGSIAPITATANVTTTSYTTNSLNAGTLYNWYIAPRNAGGAATTCATANTTTFTTAAATIALPGCVTNASPANASTLTTQTTATLTWPAAANATSYDVYLWTGPAVPASPTTNTAALTYAATGLTAGALYNWYIAPRNASGAATTCATANKTTFITAAPIVALPACVANTLPASGSVLLSQTSTNLTWSASSGATSYDVYLWTGATVPTTPTINVTTLIYGASGLTAGTTYSWYIAPKNAGGAATTCAATNKSTFTTAVATGGGNIAPVSLGGSDVTMALPTSSVTLDGSASYDPDGRITEYYWFQAQGPVSSVVTNNFSTVTTATGLTTVGTYIYVLQVTDNNGVHAYAQKKVTVNTAPTTVPPCAANSLPANAGTLTSQTTATLVWGAVGTATSYDVYLWTGATAPTTATTSVTGTTYSATGLIAGSLYNWYVVPKNAVGAATGCSTNNKSTFTTAVAIPACVTNASPASGSTITTQTSATLTWPAAAGATSYDVYIWTGATAPATPTTNTTALTYTPTNLSAGVLYSWYIAPANAGGTNATCNTTNTTTFTTAAGTVALPACVTNTSPANAGVLTTQTTATLTWPAAANATSYDVYLWTGATAPTAPTTNTTALTYGATGLTASTLYNWYIAPRNASGAATTCATANKTTFTTAMVSVPACVVNILPASGATLLSQTSTNLTWPASPTATSYDVYLWTGATVPTTPIANVTTLIYGASGLTAGALYNWYIAPRNVSGAATTCATANKTTFTTAAATGGGNLSPVSLGGSDVTITLPTSSVTLDGSASYDPDGRITEYYWFQAQGPVSSVVGNNFSTITTATGLTTAGTYIYVLQVTDNNGVHAYAQKVVTVKAAGTVTVPSCVANASPLNGSTLGTQTTATLTWPASSTATSYDVYLAAGTGTPTVLVTNTAALTYSAAGLTANTTYSWYIAPRNASGVATNCATANKTTFTTAAATGTVPACVTNTSPANASTLTTSTIATLTWPASSTATSYDVYLAAGTGTPTVLVTNTAALTYSAAGLTANTTYSWYIASRNASGVATTCGTTNKTTFTTAAGNQPTASNGGSDVTITLPISSVTLDGSASTGNIVQYYWFQAVGPVTSVVANNFSPVTTATGLTTPGTFIYVLQVIDNLGVHAYSQKTVTVKAAGTRVADTTAIQTAVATKPFPLMSALPVVTATISPNPVLRGNMARLQIASNKAGTVMINTFSSNGAIISAKKFSVLAGLNTTTVNTNGLAQGFYIINITGGERPLNMKMLLNK